MGTAHGERGPGRWWAPRLRASGQVRLGAGVSWFDDYYALDRVDAETIAIHEPRYHQENVNYLIQGRDRAMLFDTGPGAGNLAAVVAELNPGPLTVTCSHLHYDHVGHLDQFPDVHLLDLPAYRKVTRAEVLTPSQRLHGGLLEGIVRPRVTVTDWYHPGAILDLGGRRLQVLHLPGHSLDGMALHDLDRQLLFIGDFLYPGGVFVFTPGADLDDYLRSTAFLLDLIDDQTRILSAHTGRPEATVTPVMTRKDLAAVHAGLRSVKKRTARGQGIFPRKYPITDRMAVYAGLPWQR